MFDDDRVAGNWTTLTGRLETNGTLAHWGLLEPDLAVLNTVSDLVRITCADADPGPADRVIGALLRLAAPDAGHDHDALLILLHLLSRGIQALATRLQDLHTDPTRLVVGELTCQILTYPWRRRHRAHATGRLLDTRHALLCELCPGHTRHHPGRRETPIDLRSTDWTSAALAAAVPISASSDDVDVTDLLGWAARHRVADRTDLHLLLDVEHAKDAGKQAQRRLAATYQLSERTIRRRRANALRALRDRQGHYLRPA